jgi:hypothetical protein
MASPYKVDMIRKRKKFINVNRPENVDYVDAETGEVRHMVNLVGHTEIVDSTPFVKLYDYDSLMCLSLCGVRCLLYVMSAMQYGEKFRFDVSKCAEYVGCSRHYVYRGRKELEDADIIKRANSRSYFVNPNILYKGNRDNYGKCK